MDGEKASSGEREGVGLCSKCSMLGQDPSKYNSLYNQDDVAAATAGNEGRVDRAGGFGDDDDDDWGDISYDEDKVRGDLTFLICRVRICNLGWPFFPSKVMLDTLFLSSLWTKLAESWFTFV